MEYKQTENTFNPPIVDVTLTGVKITAITDSLEIECYDSTGRKFPADPYVTNCLPTGIPIERISSVLWEVRGTYSMLFTDNLVPKWGLIVHEMKSGNTVFKS